MGNFGVSTGEVARAWVFALVRSYPEGITPERIALEFGWSLNTIVGAALALEEEGKIQWDESGTLREAA